MNNQYRFVNLRFNKANNMANKMEAMKKIYAKMKAKYGPKMLYELKVLALESAKKEFSNFPSQIEKNGRLESLLSKADTLIVLGHIFKVVDPLFAKLTNSYRSERRECLGTKYYLDIIKEFEVKKVKIFSFSLKSVCKLHAIKSSDFIKSYNKHVTTKDSEIMESAKKISKLGNKFAIPPKSLNDEEVVEILEFYLDNAIKLTENNSALRLFVLPITDDLTYQAYGLEAEQINSYLDKNNTVETNESAAKLVAQIDQLITEVMREVYKM